MTYSLFDVFVMQFLKLFNGNTETPYLIWDNSTRAELTEYLEMQQEAIIKKVGLELIFTLIANIL